MPILTFVFSLAERILISLDADVLLRCLASSSGDSTRWDYLMSPTLRMYRRWRRISGLLKIDRQAVAYYNGKDVWTNRSAAFERRRLRRRLPLRITSSCRLLVTAGTAELNFTRFLLRIASQTLGQWISAKRHWQFTYAVYDVQSPTLPLLESWWSLLHITISRQTHTLALYKSPAHYIISCLRF